MDTKAFFDMSYGLYILGVMDGNRPTGCTVNTVFQITSDPPVMAISCNHQNFTNEVIKRTGRVAVAILDQDTPLDTIGGFGFRSGREVDKFDGVEFVRTSGGPSPKSICAVGWSARWRAALRDPPTRCSLPGWWTARAPGAERCRP